MCVYVYVYVHVYVYVYVYVCVCVEREVNDMSDDLILLIDDSLKVSI